MTTAAPLFEKAQALDAFVDEWIQVERKHLSEQFLSRLTGSASLRLSQDPLFSGWVDNFHPTFSPLIVELFSALWELNNRFLHLTERLGLQFHLDQPFSPWGPFNVRDTVRHAAYDFFRLMDARGWGYVSLRDRRDHHLVRGTPEPLTLENLALVSTMPSPENHGQLRGFLRDQATSFLNLNVLYSDAITRYTAAHNSLLEAVKQHGPYNNNTEVLNAFKDHILKCIDAHVNSGCLQREVQMVASNYPVVSGTLAEDGKCLFVKLADRKTIRFSHNETDWTNSYELWLALPYNSDCGFSICTSSVLQDLEGTPHFAFAEHCHPHVSHDGNLCLGDQTGFGTSLWKTKSLSALVELCRNALHCYEHDSAYWRITGDEEDEDSEPAGYCRSCDGGIEHEDDMVEDYQGYFHCNRCIEEYFSWCPWRETYCPSEDMVEVSHGSLEGQLIHADAVQGYLDEFPIPCDEEETHEELAEEQEEGKEEEKAPEPDATPSPEGEPALVDRN